MSRGKDCRLCSKLLTESDIYVAQGYCTECGNRFSRRSPERQLNRRTPEKRNNYLKAAMSMPRLAPRAPLRRPSAPRNAARSKPPAKSGYSNRAKRRGFRCNRCGDFGHMAAECRTKICGFCQARGHMRDQCFSDPDNCCAKCGTYGHSIENCRLCERCGDFGHGAEDCRTKICEDCGRRGHKKETCWSRKVCERCGITGHIAQACRTRLWCGECQQAHRRCETAATGEEVEIASATTSEEVL